MAEKRDTPRVTVSNYTKIWNLDWVVYALEGKKLPIPANLRIIGIFVVVWLVFFVLSESILFFLPKTYSLVLLPGGVTWLIAKQKLDGKAPHKWLFGMILFWLRPKRMVRYQPIIHTKHYMYDSKVIYRNDGERA